MNRQVSMEYCVSNWPRHRTFTACIVATQTLFTFPFTSFRLQWPRRWWIVLLLEIIEFSACLSSALLSFSLYQIPAYSLRRPHFASSFRPLHIFAYCNFPHNMNIEHMNVVNFIACTLYFVMSWWLAQRKRNTHTHTYMQPHSIIQLARTLFALKHPAGWVNRNCVTFQAIYHH